MASLSVVEHLQVLDQLGASRRPGGPGCIVDQLDLDRREEALGHGIVPAVPPVAHAAHDSVLSEHPLVVPAGVLRPTIRMMQQALRWAATRPWPAEGVG